MEKLFEKLLQVAPACIFPSKKVRVALQKIQTEVTRINFSRKDDETFFDRMDLLLRTAASQLRDLNQQLVVYQRTIKRSSVKEKQKVDGLLVLIKLPANEAEAAPSTSRRILLSRKLAQHWVPMWLHRCPRLQGPFDMLQCSFPTAAEISSPGFCLRS